MKNLRYVVMCLVALMCFNSCWEDQFTEDVMTEDPEVKQTVEADIFLQVVGPDEKPAQQATVYHNGLLLGEVDEFGFYTIYDITLNERGDLIEVRSDDYFVGSRTIYPDVDQESYARIKLLPLEASAIFQSDEGGETKWDNSGAKISFPARSIVNEESGLEYDGTVTMSAHYINPANESNLDQMPGDLSGVDQSDETVVLSSFSMLGVELRGESGEELNIKDGMTAEITFPIDPSLRSTAPAEIPLWYFDIEEKKWVEEGRASRVGNVYVGNVSHFSFWNCDIPVESVLFSISVKTSDNQPIVAQAIRLTTNAGISAIGRTNIDGFARGRIPSDQALVLELLNTCGETVLSQNIGPYSEDTDYGTIIYDPTISDIESKVIGQVKNCDSESVTNGVLLFDVDGLITRTNADTDGRFSQVVQNCDENITEFTIQAIDVMTMKASDKISYPLNGDLTDVGDIIACDEVDFKNIFLTMDDTEIAFLDSAGFAGFDDMTNLELSGFWNSEDQSAYSLIYLMGVDASTVQSYSKTVFVDYRYVEGQGGLLGHYLVNDNFTIDFNITEVPSGPGFIKGSFSGTVEILDENSGVRENVSMSADFSVWKE